MGGSYLSWLEYTLDKRKVNGSSPFGPNIFDSLLKEDCLSSWCTLALSGKTFYGFTKKNMRYKNLWQFRKKRNLFLEKKKKKKKKKIFFQKKKKKKKKKK